MSMNQAPADLMADEQQAEMLRQSSLAFPSYTLSKRQMCDLELLLNGGFAPLDGFMGRATYESVVEKARLPDGTLWPIPITLDVDPAFAEKLELGMQIALRDPEGFMPAVMQVEDIWQPDRKAEAIAVFNDESLQHPGVAQLLRSDARVYLGGRVNGIQLPVHHEFESLWNTPAELRNQFRKMGWRSVIAFHTSNPMHRMHREVVLAQAKAEQANVLLHPAVGVTKPGDLH